MACLFVDEARSTTAVFRGGHPDVPYIQGSGLARSDYTTLCRRQKTLNVNIPSRSHDQGALHLLVDSTGIKMMGEGEWKRRKHGPSYRRQWRKLHLGIDAQTLDIRAIEVTDNRTGDAPVLSLLLDQIPKDAPIGIVSADGA